MVARLAVLSCALLSCGGHREPSHAAATAPTVQPLGDAGAMFEPGDIGAMDKREHAPLPKQAIAIGKLTGSIEGASPPKAEQGPEKVVRIGAPIGAHSNVDCYVYPDAINPGGRLLALMKAIGATQSLTVKLALPTDAAVVREAVAIFVDVVYTVKTAQGQAGGLLKIMVHASRTTPLLCMHDEVGYHATFKRVALGLAESLELADAPLADSRYLEIEIDRENGRPVGFSRNELTALPDGTRVYQSLSTTFLIRSPTELSVSDSARTEAWERDGHIKVMSYIDSQGDDISENMVLERTGPRDYKYDGTHLGKKISGKLTTKGQSGLDGEAIVDAQVVKMLSGAPPEVRHETYYPAIDPTAPIEMIFRPKPGADHTVTLEFGQIKLTAKVDAKGRMERGEMVLGSTTMVLERVLVRGSL